MIPRAYGGGGGHATPHMPVETCRDGKMLVVTKNRTLPFSKACPNPLKNGPKPLTKLYNSPKNSRALKVNADCTAAFATRPRLVLFLVTTSILPSLQAYADHNLKSAFYPHVISFTRLVLVHVMLDSTEYWKLVEGMLRE